MTNMTREQQILTKLNHPKISDENKLSLLKTSLQTEKSKGYFKHLRESKEIKERKKYRFSEHFSEFFGWYERILTPDSAKR